MGAPAKATLRSDDIRGLFRLVQECRELRDAGESSSLHFLRGLAALARSQVAIRIESLRIVDMKGSLSFKAVEDLGWGSDSDRERVYAYVRSRPLGADPLSAAALQRPGRIVTLTRADAVSRAEWDASEVRNDIHLAAGVDDSLLSVRHKARRGEANVIVLKRTKAEGAFGDAERDLVDLAHAECDWLFDDARLPEPPPDCELSRRERETLTLLLTGASEKVIAAKLGLSPHTVHDYAKAIHKKLGVASRAELMARAMPKR